MGMELEIQSLRGSAEDFQKYPVCFSSYFIIIDFTKLKQIFSTIWDDEDLLVSMDAAGVTRPLEYPAALLLLFLSFFFFFFFCPPCSLFSSSCMLFETR